MSDSITIVDLTPAATTALASPAATPLAVPIVAGPPGPRGDTGGPSVEAAEDISAGQPIVIGIDGKARLGRADDLARAGIAGLAQVDAAVGHATIPAHGYVQCADWTAATGAASLVVGSVYWLAAGSSGHLTTAAPAATGVACVRVGLAVAPDMLDVVISSIQL